MHGGKRPGAGRKKGTQTKRTQEIVAKASSEGITPLEFMLGVLRNEAAKFEDRYTAAKDAAPYMHPRLAAVEHSGDQDNPLALAILSSVPRPDANDADVNNVQGPHTH